jgi:hypothetical protein
MSNIIDVRKLSLTNARVLLDANIWIILNGFGANTIKNRVELYSTAYKILLGNDNTIVVNDYVLGEFFNRCAKLEYEVKKAELSRAGAPIPHFKAFRQSEEFAPMLESIRDTCLNMLDDCEFLPVSGEHYEIDAIIRRCCSEYADFSDLILVEFCRTEGIYVMTDDADYAGSGVDIITANKKMRPAKM